MASTKKNSSSQTTNKNKSTHPTKNEVKIFTSPLIALPSVKILEKEGKGKESDKKNHLNHQHQHHRHHHNDASDNMSQLPICRDSSLKKNSKLKHVLSPVKLIQASTKTSNSKSSSPAKEASKSVGKKNADDIKSEVKREKNKKDATAKEKPSNSFSKQNQKNINENHRSPIRQSSKDEGDKKNTQIEKVNLNSLSNKTGDDHNNKNNLQNDTSEENEANEGNKEKEELKAKKLSPDMQTKLTVHISKTIQQRKIFAMGCSNFSTIRNALLKRGWIQKYGCEESSLKTGSPPSDPEGMFTHRMLRMVPINFIWVYTVSDWNDIKPQTLVNRFPRASAMHSFTTKIGLNYNLQQSHWFYESGIAGVKFPRTYSILSQEDLYDFVDDYIMTASTSLLKLVVRSVIRVEHDLLRDGDVPHKTLDFAINRCNDYVAFREHRDIDLQGVCTPTAQTAKEFLKNFYKIVHDGATFETAPHNEVQGTYLAAKAALHAIQRFRPQTNLDGYKNLWLLKQSNLNCGKGVQLLNTLEEIVDAVGEIKNPRYVIQKYIERPLLIYDTKFDIRQWILLTSINPLQIWMYNECYLRFSSQVFSLCDISESVHLCNNCVQRRYKNGKRHPNLPAENMWDNTTFQKYLVDIGESDKWDSVIYPGMKECIIATIMAAQEDMVERVNSFELYGVDFMLTEDFRPWLIEVNASPAMGPTTSVTTRLCSQCLNDVIKVVVDRRANPKADTGQFTLIYKQETSAIQKSMPTDFAIIGKKILLASKPNKFLSTQRSPPIVDLPKTNTGKDFCIKDSPSTCVMSILMQTKSWISDSRINEKRKQQGGDIKSKTGVKSEQELKSIKPSDEKEFPGTSPTSEFIKSTILSDLIHNTCLLTSYDESQKMVDKVPDSKNIKKELKKCIINNNENKNTIKDKNSELMKGEGSNTGKNSPVKNGTDKTTVKTNNVLNKNNSKKKINRAKTSAVSKNINEIKCNETSKNTFETNSDTVKLTNEIPLNNVYIVKNDEVKIINEVQNNDPLTTIYIVKENDESKNIYIVKDKNNDSTLETKKNDDVKNTNEINNIYIVNNAEAQLESEERCRVVGNELNSKIHDNNEEESDTYDTEDSDTVSDYGNNNNSEKEISEVKNDDKSTKFSNKISTNDDGKSCNEEENNSTVIKKNDSETEKNSESESLSSYESSKSKQDIQTSDIVARLKNYNHDVKKEENLDKFIIESSKQHNLSSKSEADGNEEEKAIQYTIYYNKDRTHFIVDVVESNTKKMANKKTSN